jgi:hypothetical protein
MWVGVLRTLTTVGYGDRSAHTDAEKLWVCCVELSGTLIFGVMAGTLTSIISEANELSLRRDRELEDIQALLYIYPNFCLLEHCNICYFPTPNG